MCIFSEYKNIFGKVGEGVHKYRFLNTAMVDYYLTFCFAMLITYLTDIPLILTTIGLFVLSILFHYLFGVETNTLKYLGITC
jgi:hypothetical protein